MKNFINVLFCMIILVSHAKAQDNVQSPEMKQLIGCWNNSQSKEWKYGFFEKFAIYNNDFWEYQSLYFKRNQATIVLKKGKETLTLKLTFDNKADSICTITSSKDKKSKFVRYTSAPNFTSEDHSSFIDNGYRTDSVTITGYLRNTDRKKPFTVSTSINFFSTRENQYYCDIDSLGRFRIKMPILNTSEVFLDWQSNGMFIRTVFTPGENIFVLFDYSTKEVRFMGKESRFKQELENYQQNEKVKGWRKFLDNDAKMDHDVFLLEKQKLYKEENDIFQQYLVSHPQVSDKFKYFVPKQILMKYASSLMQRRFELRHSINKERFSKSYMKYVDQILYQIPQPYTLCRDTKLYLNDYCRYYNSFHNHNMTFNSIETLRYLDKEKKYLLTDQQKSDLNAYEVAVSIGFVGQFEKMDSLEIIAAVMPYKKATLRADSFLNDSTIIKLLTEYSEITPAIMEMKSISKEFISFDSVPVPSILQQLIIANAFYDELSQRNVALKDQTIDYFNKLVSNENLRKIVLKQQEAYIQLAKQNVAYIESLKKTDHLKECKDADQILNQLISPYKGKVIYIDIWGTWCTPCKEEMKHAPAVKEALKDKDVIFMYLANNSPEDSWKNVIKENHLTGPNIVHYNLPDEQQNMLEKRLSVRSFPTFILIDREGKVVDMKAPRPSHKEALVDRINKLLAK